MLNAFLASDDRLRHIFSDPVAFTVYTHTDAGHLFDGSAPSIHTMLACAVFIK
jgi:hypothetical protein